MFYPSDAVSTERATELAANTRGVCFIRVGRPVVPIVYENNEQFQIGKAKVVRKSDSDKVLVIAAGITLFEALKAADTLAAQVLLLLLKEKGQKNNFTYRFLQFGFIRYLKSIFFYLLPFLFKIFPFSFLFKLYYINYTSPPPPPNIHIYYLYIYNIHIFYIHIYSYILSFLHYAWKINEF